MENKINARALIGEELRTLRKKRGYTVRSLAEMSGLGYAHIARIEAGKYNVRLDTLDTLATALGARFKLELVENEKEHL